MWIYSDNIVSCLSFKIVAGVRLPTALAWRPEHELHCHCEYEDKKHLFRTHFPDVHVIWELYYPSALWPEMQIHGFVFFFFGFDVTCIIKTDFNKPYYITKVLIKTEDFL